MLNGIKTLNGLSHRLNPGPCRQTDSNRCSYIFNVVKTTQLHFTGSQNNLLSSRRSRYQLITSKENSLVEWLLDAKHRYLGAKANRPRRYCRIVSIEHCKVVRCLIHEDPMLCRGIIVERFVTIHVIRRNVQHHRNVRTKISNPLQLKA